MAGGRASGQSGPRSSSSSGKLERGHGVKPRKPYVITKKRESWTDEEHEAFVTALRMYHRDWKRIEEYIGTKTVIQIRSHAQKYFLKIEKMGAADTIPPPRPKKNVQASPSTSHAVIGKKGFKVKGAVHKRGRAAMRFAGSAPRTRPATSSRQGSLPGSQSDREAEEDDDDEHLAPPLPVAPKGRRSNAARKPIRQQQRSSWRPALDIPPEDPLRHYDPPSDPEEPPSPPPASHLLRPNGAPAHSPGGSHRLDALAAISIPEQAALALRTGSQDGSAHASMHSAPTSPPERVPLWHASAASDSAHHSLPSPRPPPPAQASLLQSGSSGEVAPRSEAEGPNFALIYAFLGSLFDPVCAHINHLEVMQQMQPIDRETVVLLMRNISSNMHSPHTWQQLIAQLHGAAAIIAQAATGPPATASPHLYPPAGAGQGVRDCSMERV